MFHENLKRLRQERHLSQKDLAQKLSVSQQAVAKWEAHQASPNLEILKSLTDIFQISADELLGNPSSSDELLGSLAGTCHLDPLDIRLIRFYLEMEPNSRKVLKKNLLSFVNYLLEEEDSYAQYRAAYIRKNALPYAACHGNTDNLRKVPEEFDALEYKKEQDLDEV